MQDSGFIAGPGHIRHVGIDPYIAFGELDNHPSERAERLRQTFLRAGVTPEIPGDIHAALWEKFLFVVPLGGVGAVTRAPTGIIRALPETRQMLEQALREIIAVGQARGIALSAELLAKTLGMVDGLPAGATASMQRDIIEDRPSELEAQIGAVVRLGRAAGVATPVHTFIYQSLLPQEQRARRAVQF